MIKSIVKKVDTPAATDEWCEPELSPERNVMQLKTKFIIPNIAHSPDELSLGDLWQVFSLVYGPLVWSRENSVDILRKLLHSYC